ncbi:HAMP domain-containing protein [Candidatus Desantisbacteria bacterium]|nr:HAMP domain-containing protein [Candidatus Desantisbacteria bacterium]
MYFPLSPENHPVHFSLGKKIALSFLISSVIIAILAISAYMNFIGMRKEIRYLELSDTLRSKSLQIRRHEKNFFLYGDLKEIREVYTYLRDLNVILEKGKVVYNAENLSGIDNKVREYSRRFNRIETLFWEFKKEFEELKDTYYTRYSVFFPLIETTFLEKPLVNAELLTKIFSLKPDHQAIKNLHNLDAEITLLRKDGEEIVTLSQSIDKFAMEKVEKSIRMSQNALLILFPLFLLVGLGTLFMISRNVVNRLKILTSSLEKTGRGDFSSLSLPEKRDEVGILIKTFNKMEDDLIARDRELNKKNEELLQSRKLASIGTLASGVAHELNNPLNNIYLAAQTLSGEMDQDNYPQIIKESVGDIFSQTLRVKRIVHDLLEFAREKPPEMKTIDIVAMIQQILNQMTTKGEFNLKSPQELGILADRHLLQQVFINLFSNAVEAMGDEGLLTVEIDIDEKNVQIKVSDTGKGILPENISRIFDPFFTTKEKGTGLGLAIVYNIIKRHHGRIEVSSVMDEGTTFTITLPGEGGRLKPSATSEEI